MNWLCGAVEAGLGGTYAIEGGKRRHKPGNQAEGRSWRYLYSVAAFKNPVPRE